MAEEPIRQGDVILVPVEHIPRKSAKLPGGMVARGEATGHHHQFAAYSNVQIYRHGDDMYLKVQEPAVLHHEEHKAILEPAEVPAGKYKVVIQREMDLLNNIRSVRD